MAEDAQSIVVNVNGAKVTMSEQGQILAGPTAMRGQWVAPSQFEEVKARKDYHGHLMLSPTQEDVHLAEAEYSLMVDDYNDPNQLRPGVLFTYRSLSGRIEEMHENGSATVNLGGVVRPMSVAMILRDCTLEIERTQEVEAAIEAEVADIALLDEEQLPPEEVSSDNKILESMTDEELLAEVSERLAIIQSRKAVSNAS